MRPPEEYLIDLSASPDADGLRGVTEAVFERVWRFDFTQPGFCLLDLGSALNSHTLRALMIALKEHLSAPCLRRTGRHFVLRSAGRFDQQETTKFHLDGGPSESILLLGYEPSRVRCRLSLADYTRCAFDLGMTPEQFLHEHNPMFAPGERLLQAGYVTEVRHDAAHFQILLVNNSTLPFRAGEMNSLGVMHKAEIVTPNASERRIVNSIMLEGADAAAGDLLEAAKQEEFVRTEAISQKLY